MKTALFLLVVVVLCLSCEGLSFRRFRWPWNRWRSRSSCMQPKAPGRCLAYFPRFYYNVRTKRCEKFIYGGCGGNRNRFYTLKKCQQACVAKSGSSRCNQPKVTGPCRGFFWRYYYNSVRRTCSLFIYGGCHGNSNRFLSSKSCKKACM